MGAGTGGLMGAKGTLLGEEALDMFLHFFDDHRGLVYFCISTCSHPHRISGEWMTRMQGGLLAHCWLIFFFFFRNRESTAFP